KVDWGHFPCAPTMTRGLLTKQFRLFDREGLGALGAEALNVFVEIVIVWGAQHSVVFSRLREDYGIDEVEMRALYHLFEQHDPDLGGSIPADSLHDLLAGMGEDYTENELGHLRALVDMTGKGVVYFR
ncbi:unnamed protein product, partial [Discosporangium mesarthrocarpum]